MRDEVTSRAVGDRCQRQDDEHERRHERPERHLRAPVAGEVAEDALGIQRGCGQTMTSLRVDEGLNGVNFLTGAIQTAFGPFLTVYLTQQGWSQVDIGLALSVGLV